MEDNIASECIRTVAATYGCKILQLCECEANEYGCEVNEYGCEVNEYGSEANCE